MVTDVLRVSEHRIGEGTIAEESESSDNKLVCRDDIDVNVLTIEATDPRSGTAEFKAAAVRIEKLAAGLRKLGVSK